MAETDPRLHQWQRRFDGALEATRAPKRQGETPQQFQQRRNQANEALRHLQMNKPQEPAPSGRGSFGQPTAPQAQKAPEKNKGGLLGAALNPILKAMRGAQ